MSDDMAIGAAPLPLVDFHARLEQDFTGSDAQKLMLSFAQIMNKLVGVALASEKFTAANPVIQHAMQAAGSLEASAALLGQQLQQQSNIVSPFMTPAQRGPRGMN